MAFTVVDSSGLILGIRTDLTKANDLRDVHHGARVQMDRYQEDQLQEILREQAKRESYRPPSPTSETRLSITSLTPYDGYDPLTMLTQEEIDLVVAALRKR